MKVWTRQQLHHHLQTAIELEHSTLPPYLSALYSMKDGHNTEAAAIVQSVLMEEMLHMTLAGNLMNAVGGRPSINHPRFVPEYPTYLPHSNKAFLVNLAKFSEPTIETFLKIEMPAPALAPPEGNHYMTIGQFYAAIRLQLELMTGELGEEELFCGDPKRQIPSPFYYGGGGEIVQVQDLDTAKLAIDVIIDQGEGADHTILDSDQQIFGQPEEVAHYFRFNEIYLQQKYKDTDTPKGGPTGPPLPVDYTQVYDMQPNPKTADYEPGSEIWEKSMEFNRAYTRLLDTLHEAFNGRPELLIQGVGRMYDLKYLAIALMKIPINDAGQTAGPPFEFVRD